MEAVDCLFESLTHLDFINENNIVFSRNIVIFNISLKRMIFFQILIIRQIEIDPDDMRIRIIPFKKIRKCFQKFRFSRSADTGKDFDI